MIYRYECMYPECSNLTPSPGFFCRGCMSSLPMGMRVMIVSEWQTSTDSDAEMDRLTAEAMAWLSSEACY